MRCEPGLEGALRYSSVPPAGVMESLSMGAVVLNSKLLRSNFLSRCELVGDRSRT